MKSDKVRFPAAGNGTGQIDQVSIRGSFPQCSTRGIMSGWSSMTLSPGFDVFDRVLLLFADGTTRVVMREVVHLRRRGCGVNL